MRLLDEKNATMKVLHLLSSKMYSGAENVVCQIISMACESSDIEMVYCASEGPMREELIKRRIPFELMPIISVANARKVIRHQKPDIIHAHDMRACVVAALICGNRPLICHIHNNDPEVRKVSCKALAFFYPGIKARKIFWVSDAAYKGYVFRKLFAKKSTVLRNIIDIEAVRAMAAKGIGTYNYDVVFVGRLVAQKNPQRFVRIINEVAKAVPGIRAAMIGSGDEEFDESPHIERLGFISNPYKLMENARVMLITSDWEGLPMTALEAMALGVPIVSTPVDGLKDIIEDGVNGFLSEDEAELAERVKLIMEDRQLHDKMSAAQRELSEKINDRTVYLEHLMRCYLAN